MATYYLNSAGTNDAPYDTVETGANTLEDLRLGVETFTEDDIVYLCSDITEVASTLPNIENKVFTLKVLPGLTFRPKIVSDFGEPSLFRFTGSGTYTVEGIQINYNITNPFDSYAFENGNFSGILIINNCIIYGNASSIWSSRVTNSLIVSNSVRKPLIAYVNKVENCTLIDLSTQTDPNWIFYMSAAISSFKNNICYSHGSYPTYHSMIGSGGENFCNESIFDYNLIYGNDVTSAFNPLYGTAGSNCIIGQDPLFAETDTYTLSNTSPALGAGIGGVNIGWDQLTEEHVPKTYYLKSTGLNIPPYDTEVNAANSIWSIRALEDFASTDTIILCDDVEETTFDGATYNKMCNFIAKEGIDRPTYYYNVGMNGPMIGNIIDNSISISGIKIHYNNGAACICESGDTVILWTDCIFQLDTDRGIYSAAAPGTSFINCLIIGTLTTGINYIINGGYDVIIENCTFILLSTTPSVTFILGAFSSTINNSIFYFPNMTPQYYMVPTGTTISNSIWYAPNEFQLTDIGNGTNNLFIDPLFLETDTYKLAQASPAIGAGLNGVNIGWDISTVIEESKTYYLSNTGSNTYPYDTEETAANSIWTIREICNPQDCIIMCSDITETTFNGDLVTRSCSIVAKDGIDRPTFYYNASNSGPLLYFIPLNDNPLGDFTISGIVFHSVITAPIFITLNNFSVVNVDNCIFRDKTFAGVPILCDSIANYNVNFYSTLFDLGGTDGAPIIYGNGASFLNCTIIDNRSNVGGAMPINAYNLGVKLFKNIIIYTKNDSAAPFLIYASATPELYDYIIYFGNNDGALFYEGSGGSHIYTYDPEFLDTDEYMLSPTSYAIGAGLNGANIGWDNITNEGFNRTGASEVDEVTYVAKNNTSGTISIIEKINRLPELHDPDLVPIEQISYLAKSLGYNVSINRDDMGTNVGNLYDYQNNTESCCDQTVKEKYLRFIVSNLPTWYRIKGTRNSFKSMLFTFGLIGDMYYYYSNDYDTNWKLGYRNVYKDGVLQATSNLVECGIPNDYFVTPHCAIVIEIEDSIDADNLGNIGVKVKSAAEAIRPANVVYKGLIGHAERFGNINISMNARVRNTIVIS